MLSSIVEVLWTARYDYEPGWTLSPHEHEFFQVIYCLGGRGTLTLAGEPHALAPGTLFLIAPSQPHGLVAATAVKTLDIKFQVRAAALRRALLDIPQVWRRADGALAHRLERIRHEGAAQQPFYRELCATSLIEMLVALIRAARRGAATVAADRAARFAADDLPEGALSDVIAHRAVQYLHEHYAEALTMRGMSRLLGVSERHLRARLEEALGQTPHRYLTQYRVDRAKDLIAHRELALKDVAVRTGFKSVHHFTRTFTRLAGVPPGAWRRSYADGIRRDVCVNPRFVNDLTPIAPSLRSGKPSHSGKSAAVLDKDAAPPSL